MIKISAFSLDVYGMEQENYNVLVKTYEQKIFLFFLIYQIYFQIYLKYLKKFLVFKSFSIFPFFILLIQKIFISINTNKVNNFSLVT